MGGLVAGCPVGALGGRDVDDVPHSSPKKFGGSPGLRFCWLLLPCPSVVGLSCPCNTFSCILYLADRLSTAAPTMSLPTSLAELTDLVDFDQRSLLSMLHREWPSLPSRSLLTARQSRPLLSPSTRHSGSRFLESSCGGHSLDANYCSLQHCRPERSDPVPTNPAHVLRLTLTDRIPHQVPHPHLWWQPPGSMLRPCRDHLRPRPHPRLPLRARPA